MYHLRTVVLTVLSIVSVIVLSTINCLANDYEQPRPLLAKEILPGQLLKSELHQIGEKVDNDGLFNTYTVSSSFGEYKVATEPLLRQLLHEIQAIAEMRKIETGDVVVESLGESGKKLAQGIGNLFSDPESTLEGAVSGAQSLFGRARETVGRRTLSEAEDNRLEQVVGITKAKGEVATKFGVSVYSRNPQLQAELDRLGGADFAGGITIGAISSGISGIGGAVLTVSGSARLLGEVINNTPPSKLWLRNKKTLMAIGFTEGSAELFLNNTAYSPGQKTIITESLKAMKTVRNHNLLLQIALQSGGHGMADVVTRYAYMLAAYHLDVEPLESLETVARFAYCVDNKDRVILLLPTDHVIWSQRFEELLGALDHQLTSKKQDGGSKQLWSTGTFSDRALSELKTRDWTIEPDARKKLFGKQKTLSQ